MLNNFRYNFKWSSLAQAVTVVTCIREVPDSNFGPGTEICHDLLLHSPLNVLKHDHLVTDKSIIK
jgi:hypothetical protein